MALTDSIEFTQNASDIDLGTVLDASDYGVGGNPLRNATANYLLWAKTDQDGNRTFDNPDQGNVLATISYPVNTPQDGYYEAILMRVSPYDAGANYVEQQQSGSVVTQWASVVAYNGGVYQAIAPSTGVLPTDIAYWAPVSLEGMETLIANTNVHVYIQTEFPIVRVSRCTNKKFNDTCGCGCDGDLSKIQPALNLRYKIVAAQTAYSEGNPEEAEKIIREATEICSNC